MFSFLGMAHAVTANQATMECPLILLSGMGADARVFAPQLTRFPQLQVPEWIPPTPNESMAEYAKRFASQIDPGKRCYIGGASFGGMIAMEMMQHLDVEGCFLIGSVRKPSELPPVVRALRMIAPAAKVFPYGGVKLMLRLARLVFKPILSRSLQSVMMQAENADSAFMRWAMFALLSWKTIPNETAPVYHIHGEKDRVLPVRYTSPTHIIPGGGHPISMRHGKAVNEFIAEVIASKIV